MHDNNNPLDSLPKWAQWAIIAAIGAGFVLLMLAEPLLEAFVF